MVDKTGMGVGSLEAGLVEVGISILAVTAQLHDSDQRQGKHHYTSDKNQHNGNSVSVDNGALIVDIRTLVL